MKSRSIMTLVNAIGCVLLVLMCVLQWRDMSRLQDRLTQAQQTLASEQSQRIEAQRRQQALEEDLTLMKNSLQRLDEKVAETEAARVQAQQQLQQVEQERQSLVAQLENWRVAVQQRDEQNAALQAQLLEARKRLDAAIAAMKKPAQAP